MTENKRYDVIYEKEPRGQVVTDEGIPCTARTCCTRLNCLTEENKQLKKENKELNSIKHFADIHGINIFNIDEAFRKCWNDNEKLVIENKELQDTIDTICKDFETAHGMDIRNADWFTAW